MGREARVKREAPRGAMTQNELRYKHIKKDFVGVVRFSDRNYRVRPDGQIRRLSPDVEEKR